MLAVRRPVAEGVNSTVKVEELPPAIDALG